MPTFSFDEFVPTGYLVRTESRKLLYCAELDWETGYGDQMCSTYREADAFLRNAYGNWLEIVCSEYGGKGNWIKTRDCHYGEWQIEVYAANEFHPRKFAVDGQIYVRFSPKDPAERDEWGETNHWMVLDLRILMEIEAFYGLDFVADTEPEPEPEPEPDRVTYGYLYVSIETPVWSCGGSTEFDLYNDAAEAANEIEEITERILWRIQDCLGIPHEETKTASSEHWGTSKDLFPWRSTTRYWEIPSVLRVTVDWSTELNRVPRSTMIAEPVGHTEPLWFGAFKNGEGIAVFAEASAASLALWAKGALDAFSASENGVTYLTGLHDLETARKGKERGFYVYGSGVSAEGVRLV